MKPCSMSHGVFFKVYLFLVKGMVTCQVFAELFHDGGPYHIKTNPLFCSANQWSGFYMIGTSVTKDLNKIVKELEKKRVAQPNLLYQLLMFTKQISEVFQKIWVIKIDVACLRYYLSQQ